MIILVSLYIRGEFQMVVAVLCSFTKILVGRQMAEVIFRGPDQREQIPLAFVAFGSPQKTALCMIERHSILLGEIDIVAAFPVGGESQVY